MLFGGRAAMVAAMAHPGEVAHNPVTGERYRWQLTEAETGGELARAEVRVRPGGGQRVEHVHPHSEERFEVLAGRMILEAGGLRRLLVAGDRGRVGAGIPHRWWSSGEDELRVLLEVRDPRGFEAMIEDAFIAARTGQTDEAGRLRPLSAAVFLDRHRDSFRPTRPPEWALRVAVPPLALVARAARVQGRASDSVAGAAA
jgi:quercetin dioxygenase-like cupin family protein